MKLEKRLFSGKHLALLLLLLLVSAMVSRSYAQHHKSLRKQYDVLLTDETEEEDDEEDEDVFFISYTENPVNEYSYVKCAAELRKVIPRKRSVFNRELWKHYCQIRVGGE